MKLYYMDEKGNKEFITQSNKDEDIFRCIETYCITHQYGLIYIINYIEDGKIYYEFGKEGCFFVVEIWE